MKIINTKFSGLKLIKSNLFADKRGYLREIYKKKMLKKNLIFHYYAMSKKNVLRGLHFQSKAQQAKLVSVLKGKIIDICIDLRRNSKNFGKIFKTILSEKNKNSIFIPKGFAHGYLTLDKYNLVYFKNSSYRKKSYERGIRWNDSDLNINWPTKKPILSKKDKLNMSLKDFLKKYKYL